MQPQEKLPPPSKGSERPCRHCKDRVHHVPLAGWSHIGRGPLCDGVRPGYDLMVEHLANGGSLADSRTVGITWGLSLSKITGAALPTVTTQCVRPMELGSRSSGTMSKSKFFKCSKCGVEQERKSPKQFLAWMARHREEAHSDIGSRTSIRYYEVKK